MSRSLSLILETPVIFALLFAKFVWFLLPALTRESCSGALYLKADLLGCHWIYCCCRVTSYFVMFSTFQQHRQAFNTLTDTVGKKHQDQDLIKERPLQVSVNVMYFSFILVTLNQIDKFWNNPRRLFSTPLLNN